MPSTWTDDLWVYNDNEDEDIDSDWSTNLVVVVVTVEERFFPEDHAGKHAAQTPQIKWVIIQLSHITHTPAASHWTTILVNFLYSAGWGNSTTGQKLSVCVLTRVVQIITATRRDL